uniref:Zinc finger protein 777-like n=1 Tax=Cyanoderma ruficeps TaxID=181631 RepID=A0A8C3XBH2_9PASS
MKGSPRDAGPGRGGAGEPPKGAVPGGSPGFRGVCLWSLGRWGHRGGSQALADPYRTGGLGEPLGATGSPFPEHPLAKPLTLDPAQVSGSLRRRAARGPELQELRSRTERAERRLLACENLVGELGSGVAALSTLLQDYGQLQQRLFNLENLLKNRNFWILRLPPGSRGEIPKVPLTFDDISVYFNELEWERLERWQKDLYRAVMRGNYETLVSLDYAVSKPDILSQMERDEELSDKEGQEPPWTQTGHGQEPSRAAEEADEAPADETPMEAAPGGCQLAVPGDLPFVKKEVLTPWTKAPRSTVTLHSKRNGCTWSDKPHGEKQSKPAGGSGAVGKASCKTGASRDIPASCGGTGNMLGNSAQPHSRSSIGRDGEPSNGKGPEPSWTRSGNSHKTPQIQPGSSHKTPQIQTGSSQECPETQTGNSPRSPRTRSGSSQKTPQTQTGDSPKSPWTRSGNSQKTPQMQTGDSQKTPWTRSGNSQKTTQIQTEDRQNSPQTQTGDSPKSSWTRSGNSQKIPQIQTEDRQNLSQTQTGDSPKSSWTRSGNSHKTPQIQPGDSQEHPQIQTGDSQEPSETQTGNSPRSPRTRSGNSPKTPQTQTGDNQNLPQIQTEDSQRTPQIWTEDSQNSPQTQTGDSPKSSWTRSGNSPKSPRTQIGNSPKSPRTRSGNSPKPPRAQIGNSPKSLWAHTGDSQTLPQTQTGDSQNPLQTGVPSNETPEEMEQQEEASGEDPIAVEAGPELPILMMNVMSLRDCQPGTMAEEDPEMEEDLAEPDTEEASLMEDETLCEGASLEDIKVKEEEPELLAEESTPSEIRKCPKNELVKAKSKKKPNRCETSNLLMGNCRRGYVREWSHPCTECGKRFRLKINLIIHQRSHAKEGPYECPVCEIGFSNKRHLDLHHSIHVKDRAFGAKVWGNVHPELRIRPRRHLCGGGGHAAGAWLGQPKREPDGEGLSGSGTPPRLPDSRLKCPYCKKFLSCSVSLQRHLQTHARERPYCCSSCNKCFTRSNHLLRHKKIHERALAALQGEADARPPAAVPASLQRGAPEAQGGLSQGNGSLEAVKASLPKELLLGGAALGLPDNGSLVPDCVRKAVQPVVQLGSRAVAAEMAEK